MNLLPFSVYQTLGLGELKKTSVTLQLADHSVKVLKGIVEDVLIKIGDFVFPIDFIILETQPVANSKGQIPIILDRPFLAASNVLINCRNELMKLTFANMTIDLNVFNVEKQPSDFFDQLIEVNVVQDMSGNEHKGEDEILSFCLDHFGQNWDETEYLNEVNEMLDSTAQKSYSRLEPIVDQSMPSFEAFKDSQNELELKPFSENVKPTFCPSKTLSAITESNLTNE